MTSTMWAISILFAFVAGSIPFGVIIARAQGTDIQQRGSKNIGATNVARVLGIQFGLICFVLDVLKGLLPTLAVGFIAGIFGTQLNSIATNDMLLWFTVAFVAILGHMYSPWLKWRGGKGVATAFGGLVVMWPLLTVPILLVLFAWFLSLMIFRMVSLSSVVASGLLPIITFGWIYWETGSPSTGQTWPMIVIALMIAVLVIWKHRLNIRRIWHGQEPKLGSGMSSVKN
ncbi:MAG: glycerol-3-phosphate 1-O-acyltransferase PlsY [Planctomycetota bacterium]|nr:glycerol-3-phosphate 1-O-acyltransferase PlsY [Planctomycetota bacterium]